MYATLEYEDVNVHPTVLEDGTTGWTTLTDIYYKDLFIPAGFFFNGANIPRFFWRLIPPNDPMIQPAVLPHDFLCELGEYEKADDYYEEIAISTKVVKWKRISTVSGIRFYTRWIR